MFDSSELLMARQSLDSDTLDLSIGEPYFMQDIVKKIYSLDSLSFNDDSIWQYPSPNGFKDLVDLLEKKHNAKVVITNGAKQGLAAALYAAFRSGKINVYLPEPYWFSIPSLIKQANLNIIDTLYSNSIYLLTSPNNPDGFKYTNFEFKKIHNNCVNKYITLIHDAAYYTEVYQHEPIEALGDMQVFSMSKMYGISGARLGYVVCHNESFYRHLLEFQEMTTVGVSNVSQQILLNILKKEKKCPELKEIFVSKCRDTLHECREILKDIDPEILEIDYGAWQGAGMFAWIKNKNNIDFMKVKVKVAPGSIFGQFHDFIRINLGVNPDILQEAVRRINSLK